MMEYATISETILLSYEQTKIAVYEETKELFEDAPMLLELWHQDAYQTSDDERLHQQPKNEAFLALFNLITVELTNFKRMTKKVIRDTVESYKDTITQTMLPFVQMMSDVEINFSKPLVNQNYMMTDSSTTFYLMRNIVTSKKGFADNGKGHLESELVDNQGQLHGLAELRPAPLMETEPTDYLIDAVENTLSSLDELTADIFDLVSYMWMTGEHTSDGFIEFHSDDALLLQHGHNDDALDTMKFKERDRFNIMRRVAALTSVWVALNDGPDRLKIVNSRDINSKLYKFQDFKRMFEVGNVRIAFDKKTNKPKGIYALEIKPSSLLQPYLNGSKSSLGVLDLKVFKYSYFTQREHKRLTRYLSRQWKIRVVRGTLHQPFKIGTLLKEMNFPERLNGVQLRDKFEEVLDDLQRDEIIKAWNYSETIDEARVGKRGWVKNYWSQLSVTILPPDVVVLENRKQIPLPTNSDEKLIEESTEEVIEAIFEDVAEPEQESFDFDEVIEESAVMLLTPETMRAKIDELGYSIRKAAEEMGMSHTTLSRYMNHKIKRHNKDNDKKMLQWMKDN